MKVELEEYEKIIDETDISNHSLQFYVDGMGEEAGEIIGVFKRIRRGDYDEPCKAPVSQQIEKRGLYYVLSEYPLILEKVLDEIGDREWYTNRFLNQLGITLEEVLRRNAKKVKSRKKDGTIMGEGDR